MRKIHIAICDDEMFYVDEITEDVKAIEKEEKLKFEISGFTSAEELMEAVGHGHFHMIFLDVDMPGVNGVEAAKEIRKVNEDVVLCFITAYEDYALDAFEVEAIDYMVKPVSKTKLQKIIKKALVQIYYSFDVEEAKKRYVEIKTGKEKLVIDSRDIIYIEKQRNKSVFHLKEKDIHCYETLESIYQRLDSNHFIYCHQGYIIDFSKVKEVRKNIAFMGNGIEVPISRKYYKDIQERYLDKIHRLRQRGL